MFRRFYLFRFASRARLAYRELFLFWVATILTSLLIVACNRSTVVEPAPQVDCRKIVHTAGETCVPLQPERVVVLGVPTMANAIALGIKPIGTILYFDETPTYLKGKHTGIATVGTDEQPNLEKILSLQPDLIIAMNQAGLPYQQVSQIAPTVVDDWQGFPSWKDHFNFVAEVLGKTDEAEKIWTDYQNRILSLKAALGNRYQDLEVSFVHICCGTVDIDLKNSFNGMILEDAGLSRPPAQDINTEDGLILLSEERLMDIDGDIIFIAATTGESEELLEQTKQKPLWRNLRAVQQNRIYPVNYTTWRGGNPLAADAVIDDLFKYLVAEPET